MSQDSIQGREHKLSTGTSDRQFAKEIEQRKRQELLEGHHGVPNRTKDRTQLIRDALAEHLQRYKPEHENKWKPVHIASIG